MSGNMFDVRDGLYYTEGHEWVQLEGKTARFGMTDFAQHELGDVVYVDLPNVGDSISFGDEIGAMESVKTVEPIYAPVGGKVIATNELLSDSPDAVNSSPYEDGWMALVELDDPTVIDTLMDAAKYREFLKK